MKRFLSLCFALCALSLYGCDDSFSGTTGGQSSTFGPTGYWGVMMESTDGVCKTYDNVVRLIHFSGNTMSWYYAKDEGGYVYQNTFLYGCSISDFDTDDKEQITYNIRGESIFIQGTWAYDFELNFNELTLKDENGMPVYQCVRVMGFKKEDAPSNGEDNPNDDPNDNPTIEVSTTMLNFTSEGGEQTFDITSNAEWTIDITDADWLNVVPTKGKGDKSVIVEASPNGTGALREATIKVTAMHPTYGAWDVKSIKVSQSATDAPIEEIRDVTLLVNTSEVTVGEAVTFTVITNLGDDVTLQSKIYDRSTFAEVANPYTIESAGDYRFYAVYDTYISNDVNISAKVSPEDEIIDFEDSEVKRICVANWDTNRDGELSRGEAAAVTDLADYFYENGEITLFNELSYFTGLTSIGDGAFYDCSSLTSVTIPDSVTLIGGAAFEGCYSLTSVTIPDSVTRIGDGAFYDCSSLTSVTIPDSVTSIGEDAFSYCTSLTIVTIGSGVTTIGWYAFYRCDSLTSVTIGSGVTTIGWCAFKDCDSLTSVYCKPTTPPTGGSDMFYKNASERNIYVPTASVEAYKSATYWSDYADSIVGYDF